MKADVQINLNIIHVFSLLLFRICRWVLSVVPRRADPGQPGPADGLDPEHRSGWSGHRVFPEALCCCQSAGHTQRNPAAGQRTSSFPFLFVLPQAGVAERQSHVYASPSISSNVYELNVSGSFKTFHFWGNLKLNYIFQTLGSFCQTLWWPVSPQSSVSVILDCGPLTDQFDLKLDE